MDASAIYRAGSSLSYFFCNECGKPPLSGCYLRTIRCVPVPTDQTEQKQKTVTIEPETTVFMHETARPVHRHHDLRWYRWARRVSAIAPVTLYLLLSVIAYQLTGSSVWTALVVTAGCLPCLATQALSRAIPSRMDLRRVIVATDVANAAVLASVSITFSLDVLTAPHLLAAAFAAQALFAYHDAVYAAIAPYRPGRERPGMPMFGGGSAALVAAATASGILVATVIPPLLAVDGVSVAVAVLLIRALATPSGAAVAQQVPKQQGTSRSRRRVSDLFRAGRVHVLHAGVCGLHAAAGGALVGQFTPWLNEDLDVPPVRDVRLGLLLALWVAGMWLAPMLLPRLANRLAQAAGGLLAPAAAERLVSTGVLPEATANRLAGAGAGPWWRRLIGNLGGYRVTLVLLPVSGLLLLGVAFAPHWTVAAVLLLLWGTVYMMVVQDARVAESRLRMLSLGLGWSAGALLGGVVAAVTGPRLGIATGVLMIAAAAAVAWQSSLRTADRMPLVPATGGIPLSRDGLAGDQLSDSVPLR